MLPITGYRQGERARVAYLGHDVAVAERLRTLGVREGACVCVMLNTDKCILAVDGCRLALQREVAEHVYATDAAGTYDAPAAGPASGPASAPARRRFFGKIGRRA